jgi:peptide-methionine (S)-S-oxide reductase
MKSFVASKNALQHPGPSIEYATLGGGCFWCFDAVFRRLEGVIAVECGYAGGHVPNPTYEQVCGKQTGHAEVVRVTFDGWRLSYRDLMVVFFGMHDPTTLNQQGNDVGPQYRSVIFYHDRVQEELARLTVKVLSTNPPFPKIVTEVLPIGEYYRAEDEHQNYWTNHPEQGYCQHVVRPKIDQLMTEYWSLTTKTPVTT